MKLVREAPWTLKAYAAVSVAAWILNSALGRSPALFIPLAAALLVIIVFFVFRRSRVAWSFQVFADVSWLAVALPVGKYLWQVPFTVASLALLIAPPSRRWVWRPWKVANEERIESSPSALPRTPQPIERRAVDFDPTVVDDADRPLGWYVDSDDPDWMYFWSRDGEWRGRTRTPRKIRRQWLQRQANEKPRG